MAPDRSIEATLEALGTLAELGMENERFFFVPAEIDRVGYVITEFETDSSIEIEWEDVAGDNPSTVRVADARIPVVDEGLEDEAGVVESLSELSEKGVQFVERRSDLFEAVETDVTDHNDVDVVSLDVGPMDEATGEDTEAISNAIERLVDVGVGVLSYRWEPVQLMWFHYEDGVDGPYLSGMQLAFDSPVYEAAAAVESAITTLLDHGVRFLPIPEPHPPGTFEWELDLDGSVRIGSFDGTKFFVENGELANVPRLEDMFIALTDLGVRFDRAYVLYRPYESADTGIARGVMAARDPIEWEVSPARTLTAIYLRDRRYPIDDAGLGRMDEIEAIINELAELGVEWADASYLKRAEDPERVEVVIVDRIVRDIVVDEVSVPIPGAERQDVEPIRDAITRLLELGIRFTDEEWPAAEGFEWTLSQDRLITEFYLGNIRFGVDHADLRDIDAIESGIRQLDESGVVLSDFAVPIPFHIDYVPAEPDDYRET